jgi:hypothetical protein
MYIIFSKFKKLTIKLKKKSLTPGMEQLAHGTVAQGTRHKAPTIDKEDWFRMCYPFSPIPTDPEFLECL